MFADAITSLLAVAALAAGHYSGVRWLDPAVAIVGAAVIAQWAWKLIQSASAVLLDKGNPALETWIRGCASNAQLEVEDVHVWRVGPNVHAALLHVAGEESAAQRYRAALLASPLLAHVTVERR